MLRLIKLSEERLIDLSKLAGSNECVLLILGQVETDAIAFLYNDGDTDILTEKKREKDNTNTA